MEPKSSPTEPGEGLQQTPPASSPRRSGIDRRALLKAGAGASPILLALRSGPVSATGTTACTVASSFVSAATFASRSPGSTYIKCSSRNAGHWRTDAQTGCAGALSTWPAWAKVDVQTHLCATGSSYDSWKIGDVMRTGSSLASTGNLAILQHLLGLSLTITYTSSYITTAGAAGGELTTPYLVTVWQQYRTTGRYTIPSDNVDWDEAKLLTWLKMLQYDIPVA